MPPIDNAEANIYGADFRRKEQACMFQGLKSAPERLPLRHHFQR
tara:strand:- start:480 stop:611 length:132 start_codon:yes stop_codon:yes gene_type:complete